MHALLQQIYSMGCALPVLSPFAHIACSHESVRILFSTVEGRGTRSPQPTSTCAITRSPKARRITYRASTARTFLWTSPAASGEFRHGQLKGWRFSVPILFLPQAGGMYIMSHICSVNQNTQYAGVGIVLHRRSAS